jgi:hypothetical protein
MRSRVSPPEEFSQGLVRFAHRRRKPGLGEAWRRLLRRGLGEATDEAFFSREGSEDAERLGVEMDFRFREGRAARWGGFWGDVGDSWEQLLHLDGEGFGEFEAKGGLGGQDNLLVPGVG